MIVTWGRGREGQLGTGARVDIAHPRAVEELRGRRVLQVKSRILFAVRGLLFGHPLLLLE